MNFRAEEAVLPRPAMASIPRKTIHPTELRQVGTWCQQVCLAGRVSCGAGGLTGVLTWSFWILNPASQSLLFTPTGNLWFIL